MIPFIGYSRTDRTNQYRLIRKWLPGAGNGVDWFQRGTRKLLAVMQMFCILNRVRIIGLFVKSHQQLYSYNVSIVLCIIYASVMFILKIKKILKCYMSWICVELRNCEIAGGFEWHQRKVWNFCVERVLEQKKNSAFRWRKFERSLFSSFCYTPNPSMVANWKLLLNKF